MAGDEYQLSAQILIFCLIPRKKNNLEEIDPCPNTTPMMVVGWQTLIFFADLDILFIF